LGAGFNIEAKDSDGKTPLHCAVVSGEADRVEVLVAAGADVTATVDRSGNTLLHLALQHCDDPVIYRRIIHLDSTRHDSVCPGIPSAPVRVGRYAGSGDYIVELLLVAGADIRANNNDGHSPLSLAVDHDPINDLDDNGVCVTYDTEGGAAFMRETDWWWLP